VPEWVTAAEGYDANAHDVALFDLLRDPGQKQNVCEQHPDVVVELQALLARLREQGWSAPRLLPKEKR
jgi:hypothetical protein